jgi:hypothetical protein
MKETGRTAAGIKKAGIRILSDAARTKFLKNRSTST